LKFIVVVVPTTVEVLVMLPKVMAAATEDTPCKVVLISSTTFPVTVIV